MVLFSNPEKIEDHAAVTITEHVTNAAGRVGPQSHCHHIDHRFDLFVEVPGTLGSFET